MYITGAVTLSDKEATSSHQLVSLKRRDETRRDRTRLVKTKSVRVDRQAGRMERLTKRVESKRVESSQRKEIPEIWVYKVIRERWTNAARRGKNRSKNSLECHINRLRRRRVRIHYVMSDDGRSARICCTSCVYAIDATFATTGGWAIRERREEKSKRMGLPAGRRRKKKQDVETNTRTLQVQVQSRRPKQQRKVMIQDESKYSE